jgi:hypothetical protein
MKNTQPKHTKESMKKMWCPSPKGDPKANMEKFLRCTTRTQVLKDIGRTMH